MRTFIYIDGFNLYYGCLKNSNYKWLDLMTLSQKLLKPRNDIQAINFYTAIVKPNPNDPQAPQRQEAYLRALKEYIPQVNIHYGHFLRHKVRMANANPPPNTIEVFKTEEKGSDVNLAVHLLNDAWLDKYDCAVIISNDSDMAESLKMVRIHHPNKVIGLITPGEAIRTSEELKAHAHFIKKIRNGLLQRSQLPIQIIEQNTNHIIHKPIVW